MKIKTKLSLWNIFTILFMVIIFLVVWININKLISISRQLFKTTQVVEKAINIENNLERIEINIQSCVLFKTAETFKRFTKTKNEITFQVENLRSSVDNKEKKEQLKSILNKINKWFYEADKFILKIRENSPASLPSKQEILNTNIGKKYLDIIRKDIHNFHKSELILMDQERLKSIKTISNTFAAIALCTIVIILIQTILSYFISLRIRKPILHATDMMKSLVTGSADLTKNIECKSNDEINGLVSWFNKFIDNYRDNICEIKDEVKILEEYSKTLSDASTKLANESVSNSSSINHMSTAMEDLKQITEVYHEETSKTLKGNEENISVLLHKNNIGQESAQIENMNEKLKVITDLLSDLNNYAYDIEEFIKSIKEIAVQSRILSVNTSVQASKAGENGKGFNVIADEIKNLSSNSEKSINSALKTYKSLLNTSQQCSLSIESIQMQIFKLLKRISEINNDIENKSDLLNNISNAFSRMDMSRSKQLEGMTLLTDTMIEIKDSSNLNADAAKSLEQTAAHLMQLCNKLKDNSDSYIVE